MNKEEIVDEIHKKFYSETSLEPLRQAYDFGYEEGYRDGFKDGQYEADHGYRE